MPKTEGFIAKGYEKVRQAFEQNFTSGQEVGAACCIYRDGKPVVNIWGGLKNSDTQEAWNENTVQVIFSAIKGMTTICILSLVEQGKLNLDEPIATYWPEFAAEGKDVITLSMVLSHRAGVPFIDGDFTLQDVYDRDLVIEAIARQRPAWEPGTAHGYHVRTFGWILGEVVRRVTGKSFGEVVQDTISKPLGIPLWVGLPDSEMDNVAKLIPPPTGSQNLIDLMGADSIMVKAITGPSNLFDYNEMWNTPELLRAEMPSSNGVSNAHALAKIYASLLGNGVDNIRLLTEETVKNARQPLSSGPDSVIVMDTVFGTGFNLPAMLAPVCGENSFGHPGAGGSIAFADPDAGISFGYVSNKMRVEPGIEKRTEAILEATYQSL